MKKAVAFLVCLLFPCLMGSALSQTLSVTGKVTKIEKFGHARLDITFEDFLEAGFAFGDLVTVKTGSFEEDMPFFNGYYAESGESMIRGYPGQKNIALCINYGNFADTAGVSVGDAVTLALKEKAGALAVQQAFNLVYTNDRADYDSDEIFANFRSVRAGRIGEGKLYRSASPVNHAYGRNIIANRLIREAGIRSVMNMADTDEGILKYPTYEDFDSAYYMDLVRNGHVIALGMPIDFSSDAFAKGMVRGLTFLAGQEPPYLVHCTESKDRAGLCLMLLEALMGASEEEITEDYLASYINYYHLDPDRDAPLLEVIAEKNVLRMLRTLAGTGENGDLADADLSRAAENYLLSHGMEEKAMRTLMEKLQ